ncbi:MAG: FAS1 domain-containing protein [Benjaminiella poitrasii]|nr:MAG: FAS1 domain-containing protein [Benjaminiella poitrasii]
MKKSLVFIFLLSLIQPIYSEQHAFMNKTILDSLDNLSPILYSYLQDSSFTSLTTSLYHLLGDPNRSLTLLLPDLTALNASLQSDLLGLSSIEANNALSLFLLDGLFHSDDFSVHRQLYSTFHYQSSTNHTTTLSIGPFISSDYQITANDFQIYSGLTKAKIMTKDIQCKNGVIHIIDHFLHPSDSPLNTISAIAETEYMEGLLKSLNVSDIISGTNKTILAPTNEAWERANGTQMPFGTLVHHLKYLTLDGLYSTQGLLSLLAATDPASAKVTTDYQQLSVSLQIVRDTSAYCSLVLNNKSSIVQADILTTSGIIHLIDFVLSPDDSSFTNTNTTTSIITSHDEGELEDTTTSARRDTDRPSSRITGSGSNSSISSLTKLCSMIITALILFF